MNFSRKDTIKVGICGLGRAGFLMHVPELEAYPELFKITAGCDLLDERLQLLRQKHPDAAVYQDFEDFLRDASYELCAIAVRSPQHVDYALKALRAGKTVFLEKPFALSEEGAALLEHAAEQYPGKLFFRLNRRFESCFNKVLDIMKEGLLGEVYEIKLRRHNFQNRMDWQTLIDCGGGQINNWGPHLIDHSLRLLESPLKDLWSDFRHVSSRGDAEDHIKVLFRGENGRVVDLEISNGIQIPSNVYEVYGTRGTLVSADENTIHLKYLDPAFEIPKLKANPGTVALESYEGAYGGADKWPWIDKTIPAEPANGWNMQRIYEFLYAAILEGKPFPVRTEEALQVVRVTAMLKKQNPAFPIRKDEFSGPADIK